MLRLETRATILDALEDIPAWFIGAVQAGECFPDALDLRHAVTQLCDILVKNLEELIQVLLRTHPEKHRGKLSVSHRMPGPHPPACRS